jgi:hypothetical protein
MATPGHIGSQIAQRPALRADVAGQAAAAGFSLLGLALDCRGHESMQLAVHVGATSGAPTSFAVDAKLQDSADGVTFADVAADKINTAVAIQQITTINTSRVLDVNVSRLRAFARLVFTVAFVAGTSPRVSLSANAAQGGGPHQPPA